MSHPLSRLESLLRIQMPGAPTNDIAGAIEDLVALASRADAVPEASSSAAPDVLSDRVASLETVVGALKDAAAGFPDIAGKVEAVTEAVASLRSDFTSLKAATPAPSGNPPIQDQLDATGRALVDVQGQLTKLQADVSKLEAARPTAAPARAAAPAARPAASA